MNEIILATEPLLDNKSFAADDQSISEQANQVLQAGHFRFISAAQALDQADCVRAMEIISDWLILMQDLTR